MALKRNITWFFVYIVLAAMDFLFSLSPALADFRVCNATQKTIGVAVGYRLDTGWMSEGWWHIEATSCKTLIEGVLASRFYYLYGEDANGAKRWGGTVMMCASENEFKIDGVIDCFARGFQRLGFQEIDTKNQSSWMVQLTEPGASDSVSSSQEEEALTIKEEK